MAVVCFWDNSCCIQKPRIALPSVHPRPSRCLGGWNTRFSGHRLVNPIVCSQVRMEDVVEIAHNKVLMAAAVSGAIGQLAKPFTRVFLGKAKEKKTTAFDMRAAIESGGFPSSHSSAVTATASSLLLERGFADSIFGLSLIYAAIVMYDAQGVRREVGKHARFLNKKHLEPRTNPARSSPVKNTEKNAALVMMRSDSLAAPESQARAVSVLTTDENGVAMAVEEEDEEEMIREMLKEGVGHTEVEVVAGALLGISVSLFIYNFI